MGEIASNLESLTVVANTTNILFNQLEKNAKTRIIRRKFGKIR